MSAIDVVFITDENYARPTAVAVHSLVRSSQTPLRIHVVMCDVTSTTKMKLQRAMAEISSSTTDIQVVDADLSLISSLPVPRGRFPRAVWLKCILDRVLPSLQRVIYIDSDTIIRKDLAELWNMDLGDCSVAAGPDYEETFNAPVSVDANGVAIVDGNGLVAVKHYKRFGFSGSERLFNTGVLLCDLGAWRRGNASQRAENIIRVCDGDTTFADQDILNMVFANNWLQLDSKWNDMEFRWRDRRGDPAVNVHLEESAILHFAGRRKPWHPDYRGTLGPELYSSIADSFSWEGLSSDSTSISGIV